MARLLDDAIPHYISAASAVLSGVPISMACWFNSDSITLAQTLVGISDTAGDLDHFKLDAAGGEPGDFVMAVTGRAGQAEASTSLAYTADTWHHACAVFDAVDSRAAYLDGGNKGTNADSRTPAGLDTMSIGVSLRSSAIHPLSGLIAEVGIWNIALLDAEIAILAEGYSPLLVRPQNLVFYAPLVREILDVVGGVTLVNTGSTVGDHPRVLLPAPPSLVAPPAPAVTAIASQRLKIGVGR